MAAKVQKKLKIKDERRKNKMKDEKLFVPLPPK